MKKFLLPLLIFLTVCTSVSAQFPMGGPGGGPPGSGVRRPEAAQPDPTASTSAPRGSSTLKGIILDSLDATPVAYANVLLYGMPEKKVLEGVLADGEGKFAFEKIAAGSYMLEISFPGYRTHKIENITLVKAQILDLGNVQLPLNITTLNEVTISSQQSIIEEKVDRLVYNAERDLTSKGGDASDVLRKVPMLSVDLDGNVSMRGSSNIRVLINNKPSTIMASSVADALKQIPADMIKTVEVITSPSAKYDAEGSGGIINIITKKTTLQGYSLNVDLGAGNRSANLGLNGSYRKGKMGFTLGGFGRGFFNPSESKLTQSTLSAGKTLVTNQSIEAFDLGAFGSYNLGWDYELAKNQFLSAGLRYGMRNFSRDQSQNTNVYENTLLLTSNSREVDSRDISNNFDGNIDYLHTFKKPSQEWSMSGQFSRTNLTNNFDANNLNSLKEIINRQRNINLNTNQEITFQSDYQHPIGSNQMLEFGGKGIFRQVVSDYKYEISNSATGEFLIDGSNPAGILDYRQNVAATYLSYTYSTKSKLTFKGGARYEYTNIAAEIVGEDTLSIPDYGTLVPSLNISKNLKTGGAIKVGYNRRIQRPGLQQLNPNYNTANTQNITIGNPNLEPEMTDNIELSLSKNVKKTYFNVSLFGRMTNNSITQVRQASDELQGAIITTFENIGKQQAIGTNVFANVFITPKWTVNGGVDMFYAFLEGRTTINGQSVPLSNSGFNINGRIMTQLTFGKGWTAQGFSFIRGGQVQLQGRQGGFYMYSLGARKDFKNKKGSIGLSAENFLARGIKVRTELSSPEFTSVNEDLRLNRGIKVNFTYKLGKMTFEAPRRKAKSVNNDDVKAGEGNGNQ